VIYIIIFILDHGQCSQQTHHKTIMGNDVSTFEAGSRSNNNGLDLGDKCGRWYQTNHFRARTQERHISRSSISRAIRSGRREDGRDGTVKCTGDDKVVVVLKELKKKARVLITAYTVGEPEPEPGWGSLGVIAAMGLIGGVLLMAMAEAQRRRE
jgi:Domain of unknown function (DUF4258)